LAENPEYVKGVLRADGPTHAEKTEIERLFVVTRTLAQEPSVKDLGKNGQVSEILLRAASDDPKYKTFAWEKTFNVLLCDALLTLQADPTLVKGNLVGLSDALRRPGWYENTILQAAGLFAERGMVNYVLGLRSGRESDSSLVTKIELQAIKALKVLEGRGDKKSIEAIRDNSPIVMGAVDVALIRMSRPQLPTRDPGLVGGRTTTRRTV
jgi:hypothetical protein